MNGLPYEGSGQFITFLYLFRRTGFTKLILDAHSPDHDRAFFRDYFGDGTSQSSQDARVLHGNKGTRLPSSGQDRFLIERFNRMDIEDPRSNPILHKLLGNYKGIMD